jgi:hypothetical protein
VRKLIRTRGACANARRKNGFEYCGGASVAQLNLSYSMLGTSSLPTVSRKMIAPSRGITEAHTDIA